MLDWLETEYHMLSAFVLFVRNILALNTQCVLLGVNQDIKYKGQGGHSLFMYTYND